MIPPLALAIVLAVQLFASPAVACLETNALACLEMESEPTMCPMSGPRAPMVSMRCDETAPAADCCALRSAEGPVAVEAAVGIDALCPVGSEERARVGFPPPLAGSDGSSEIVLRPEARRLQILTSSLLL